MDLKPLIDLANSSVYPLQALMALFGLYCVVLVLQRIRAKQFASTAAAEQFLANSLSLLQQRKHEELAALCDSPPYWSKAVPQLMLLALAQREKDVDIRRRLLSEKFDRDVVADLEYRMSWVNTVVKSAPMLGLLGTVLGMISAFGKIAATQQGGNDPSLLANDISFALITTAVGLMIAIPLVLCTAFINVRLGRLQDTSQHYLGEFLDEFDRLQRLDARQERVRG